MKAEYDLSRVRSRKNPYTSRLEKTVTVVIDDQLMKEVLAIIGCGGGPLIDQCSA